MTLVGNSFLTPQTVDGYPRRERDEDGNWKEMDCFRIAAANLDAYLPSTTDKNSYGHTCSGVEIEEVQGSDAGVVKVTLTYGGKTNDSDGSWNGGNNDSTLTLESDTQWTEHKIDEHPEFSTLTDAEKKLMQTHFPVFSVANVQFIVRQKIAKKNFRFSFAQISDTTGSTGAPPYLKDPGTASNWMHLSRRIAWTKGEYAEIEDVYSYSQDGWLRCLSGTGSMATILAAVKSRHSVGVNP